MSDVTQVHLALHYSLKADTSLHIGAGCGHGSVDRLLARDHRNLPYIPGSTIKGRCRMAAMALCARFQVPHHPDPVARVRFPMPAHTRASEGRHRALPVANDADGTVSPDGCVRGTPTDDADPSFGTANAGRWFPNGPNGHLDLPNRIFGAAWHPCTLRFSDASLDVGSLQVERRLPSGEMKGVGSENPRSGGPSIPSELARAHRDLRTRAARNRRLGTAGRGHLFSTETVPAGVTFTGSIQGWLGCRTLFDMPVEAILLWLSFLQMVTDGLGGDKTAGSGHFSLATPVGLAVDGQPFQPVDLPDVLDLLEDWHEEVSA